MYIDIFVRYPSLFRPMNTELFADGRIKLRHLQCFLAVARTRSIQRAADALAITQPAVSRTIRELESALGVRLFERSRRGTQPTAQAEQWQAHAQACVDALRTALCAISDTSRTQASPISLGALPTVAPGFLPAALCAFQRRRPGVTVRVLTAANDTLLASLKSAELDLAIGRLADPRQMVGVSFEHLYAEPLQLVVRPGHPLLQSDAVLAELTRWPAVMPLKNTVIRHSADSLLARYGLAAPTQVTETISTGFARAMTRASDAVWFVPAGAVACDLAEGLLASVPIATTGTDEPVGLMTRSGEPAGATLLALLETIRVRARGGRHTCKP
jgi:LysR family transcriptional regulator, pca operon transcriptional activator